MRGKGTPLKGGDTGGGGVVDNLFASIKAGNFKLRQSLSFSSSELATPRSAPSTPRDAAAAADAGVPSIALSVEMPKPEGVVIAEPKKEEVEARAEEESKPSSDQSKNTEFNSEESKTAELKPKKEVVHEDDVESITLDNDNNNNNNGTSEQPHTSSTVEAWK